MKSVEGLFHKSARKVNMVVVPHTMFTIFIALLFLILGIGGTIIFNDFAIALKESVPIDSVCKETKPETSSQSIAKAADAADVAAVTARRAADAADVAALSARRAAESATKAAADAAESAHVASESENISIKPLPKQPIIAEEPRP